MPLLLCMKTFITSFSKYRSVPLRFLLLLGEKKVPTEKSDDTLLFHKFFTKRTFGNHWGPPKKIFWYCGTKNIEKTEMPPTPPPPRTHHLLCMNFSLPGFSKQRSVPLQLFRHCTTETFRWKDVIAPQFLSISCFFHTRSFENTKVPSNENLWYRETKVPNKPWCPPTPMHETFHHHIFFERQKGSPYEHFQHCETKLFRPEKRDTPLFIHKLFPYQNNSESQGSPLRNFWLMWDEKKVEKAVMPPLPLLCVKFLNTRTFWNTEGSPTTLLGTVRQKLSTEKHDTLPLIKSIFPYQNVSETQGSPLLRMFSALWDKTCFWQENVIPPS